jgi:hypothetical protein
MNSFRGISAFSTHEVQFPSLDEQHIPPSSSFMARDIT